MCLFGLAKLGDHPKKIWITGGPPGPYIFSAQFQLDPLIGTVQFNKEIGTFWFTIWTGQFEPLVACNTFVDRRA